MKNFKYCLWLMPSKGHLWQTITVGFLPHLSIATDLTLDKAITLMNNIKETHIKVNLEGKLEQIEDNGFVAAYYKVKPAKSLPFLWPKEAHISFAYQYDKLFTNKQIDELEKKIINKSAILNTLKIMKCNGHFKDWYEVA